MSTARARRFTRTALSRWASARRGDARAALTAPVGPKLATALVLIGIAASVALAESVHTFPYEDVTNDLARYAFLDRAWFGGHAGVVPSYIATHLRVSPYLGFDVVGAALVHLLGPPLALRVIAALVVSAVPLGCWMLVRAVCPNQVTWSLAGVLLGISFFSVVGFVNYDIGLGATLAWLALWWPRRGCPSGRSMLALNCGVVVLYLLHLSAPLMVLVVVWLDLGLLMVAELREARLVSAVPTSAAQPAAWRRTTGVAGSIFRERRCQLAIAATATVAVMGVLGGVGMAPPTLGAGLVQYPPLSRKLVNLFTPFYVFSIRQAAITGAVYGVLLGTYVWSNRDTLRKVGARSVFAIAAVAFVVLFLVFPAGTPGTGYLDMRWLPPAFLLPFAAVESGGRAPSRAIAVLLLAGCLLHDAVIGTSMRTIDHELVTLHTVLDGLPPGGRLLPLIADGDRHGVRVFPYRHFAFWYVIDRDGRVPALFNADGEGGGRPHHAFLSHFVERDHLYEPWQAWGTVEFAPLNWTAIDRDYDYIVQAGSDPRATRLIADHARFVTRVGEVTVYTVR